LEESPLNPGCCVRGTRLGSAPLSSASVTRPRAPPASVSNPDRRLQTFHS
jgi:hypothetical protein